MCVGFVRRGGEMCVRFVPGREVGRTDRGAKREGDPPRGIADLGHEAPVLEKAPEERERCRRAPTPLILGDFLDAH